MNPFLYAGGLLGTFLLWTLAVYAMHRLSHWRHPNNPLYRIHRSHHQKPYLRELPHTGWPPLGHYVFWFGDWRSSLDVLLNMTVPLLLITMLLPAFGVPLLVLHYLYEVFLSEGVLDHNPRVDARWTRWFAWGDFHLHHHADPAHNFGLMVTLWDHVFGSAERPEQGFALRRVLAQVDERRAATAEPVV